MNDSGSGRRKQQVHNLLPSSMDTSTKQHAKTSGDELSDGESCSVSKSDSLPLSAGAERDRGKDKDPDSRPSKRKKTAKFKKHPDAPKRFRSAFIIFSKQRHQELRTKLEEEGEEMDTMNIAGRISDEWRTLDRDSKVKWEDMAREDKERYQREKDAYSGPWKVKTNLRKPKDPNSPKKPVPAYFAFSNERRQEVKNQNPNATNGEISRLLSKMWNEAPDEIRRKYLDQEAKEREVYTEKMKEWRARRKERKKQLEKESASKRQAQSADTRDIVARSSLGDALRGEGHVSFPFASSSLDNSATLIPSSELTRSGSPSLDAIRMLREGLSSTSQNFAQLGFMQHNRSLSAGIGDSGILSQLLGARQPNLHAATPSTTGSGELNHRFLMAAIQRQVSPPSQAHFPVLGAGQLNGMNSTFIQQAMAETGSSRTAGARLIDMLNLTNQQQQQLHFGSNHSLNIGQPGAGNSNMELLLLSRLLQKQQQSASEGQHPFPMTSSGSNRSDTSQQDAMLQSFLRYLSSGGEGKPYSKPPGS